MSTLVRIGGAFAVGIAIILGTLVLQSRDVALSTKEGALVVVPPSEKKAAAPKDADGDGTPDWQKTLSANAFEAISTPTTSTSSALASDTAYTPPTTLTGKFAQAFFEDYMREKSFTGELTDQTTLVETALKAVDENTQNKLFTRDDIVIIPDSPGAARVYGNALGELIIRTSNAHKRPEENELLIFKKALETNDADLLKELEPIALTYADLVEGQKKIPVPEALAESHLTLLNVRESVRVDIEAMGQLFTDPLYAYARVKRYTDDSAAIVPAFHALVVAFERTGVAFSGTEYGSLVYTFEQ